MTKKIYELDSYMTESLANVREMIEDDEGNVWVSFDQTIFYPEAGGQPYDQGKVDGAQVLNVQIKDKDIFHQVTEKMVKQRVKLKVDFNRRFDHMQQHTGQHLLSAVWKELYQVETTSFHLGPTVCTIDLDLYEITEAEIEKVELYVSQYIYENRSVETYVKTIDEVNIENYPNIKESELYIRFVEIEGVDVSTCCGTHVNALGEIGCVKVIGWEKYKGKTRLHFVCGQRALRYFQQVHAIATELKKKFNSPIELIEDRITKFFEGHQEFKKEFQRHYEKSLNYEASEILRSCSSNWMISTWPNRSVQEMKDLAKIIINHENKIVVFHSEKHRTWIFASSSSSDFNVTECIKALKELYGGNGGGSTVFGQWTGSLTMQQWEMFQKQYL